MVVGSMEWLIMEWLICKAEREGKWLHCNYQDLWFSPSELREHQAKGDFRWGPVNWTLREPSEKASAIGKKSRKDYPFRRPICLQG